MLGKRVRAKTKQTARRARNTSEKLLSREESNTTTVVLHTHVVFLGLNVTDVIAPPFPIRRSRSGAAAMPILGCQKICRVVRKSVFALLSCRWLGSRRSTRPR